MSATTDINMLALCLYREARGEGLDGMTAVACVIHNRVTKWKQTWKQVIMGKNQFTSMSVPSDSQFNLVPEISDKLWKAALNIAEMVYTGEVDDPTKGALYYGNMPVIAAIDAKVGHAGWFVRNISGKPGEHPETVTLGRHTFFM